MDQQHKRLFDLLNSLHGAIKNQAGKQATHRVIDELVDYTGYHFGAEEDLLRQYNYPALRDQEMMHQKFVATVVENANAIKSGSANVNPLEVMKFLKDWLFTHIKGEDKKYGEYING